jgi:hypothetical protein
VLKNASPVHDYVPLSFPEVIDAVGVRNSPRVRLRLPAKVTGPSSPAAMEADIDNIGRSGALLVCPQPLGGRGDTLQLEFEVMLDDIPVSLALNATIRSSEPGTGQTPHRHGVAFVDPTPHDRLALAALVWFHIYENPALSV